MEPNYPISVVTRGKRVFVVHGQSLQSADHDFSKISLIPTVVLLHDVLEPIDQSFYRETPYIYMKVHATGPSSAIRNVKETANASLINIEQGTMYFHC